MEMFNVVIQLGAIMAVVVLYFHKLNPVFTEKDKEAKASHMADVDQSGYRISSGGNCRAIVQ